MVLGAGEEDPVMQCRLRPSAVAVAVWRFLTRFWDLVGENWVENPNSAETPESQAIERLRHKTIKRVTEEISNLRFNGCSGTSAPSEATPRTLQFLENPRDRGQSTFWLLLL